MMLPYGKILIATIIVLFIIFVLIPSDNDLGDGCYEKDSYTCLNCKKHCKYHYMMEDIEYKKERDRSLK